MADMIENGTVRDFDGKPCIHYDGYWLRYYITPEDSLATKHLLIKALTRRAFHLTEKGINTPGVKLDEARRAYEEETDPDKKRINGAMLAGALFNRASDIFTVSVELAEKGVEIGSDNTLLKLSSDYFTEALEFGKYVKHYSGAEGLDEVWGEPLKAFAQPVNEFYKSRYIKIASAMRSIDEITIKLKETLEQCINCKEITPLIDDYAEVAKLVSETMKRDNAIFTIWPRFIASKEKLLSFEPDLSGDENEKNNVGEFTKIALRDLLEKGIKLIKYITDARVPMIKSQNDFFADCDRIIELNRQEQAR